MNSCYFESTDPEARPLCENNTPIVEDIGHGGKYKAEHPEYQGGYIKLGD